MRLTIKADGSVLAKKTIRQPDGSKKIERVIYPDKAAARADGHNI